ncbi:MAG: MFS transporter, partial [Chloroflexota bacterium]|nr:MFS transporter [Chloroflexota bacterium]
MRRRIPPVQRSSQRASVPVTRSRHRLTRPHHRVLDRLPNNRHPERAEAVTASFDSTAATVEHRTRLPGHQRRFRHIRRRGWNGSGAAAESSLLNEADFRMLWLSRLLSQTAQGALLYAMLILVVDLSDRTIYSSLFVLCSIIPSLVFGLPAGVVVDAVPRRGLLVILNLLRFTFMLFIVSAAEPSLGDVFAATLGIWVIHQFYAPAEASVMGAIVPSRRYTSAQALFNLALTIAQALGLVLLAPLLLRAGGPRTVFAAAGLLFMVAGLLAVLLPAVGRAEKRHLRSRLGVRDILAEGWRFAKGDRPTLEAILDDVLVGIGMSALVV